MTTPQNTKPARLYRSRDDRVIAGVAGGIARYLGIDPVLVRLAIVALAIVAGSGVVAYLIAWLIIPEEPGTGEAEYRAATAPAASATGQTRMIVGIGLVIVGATLLARWAIPSFNDFFWPLMVIASGVGLLILGSRR
jgi:phage shock protein C